MESTMQDIPLNISRILEYGASVHGNTEVITWENGSSDVATFAHIRARAAALAHVLSNRLGIAIGDRVASFMYNCAEHLETFFAASCMGAVFNPLNKQLMDDQIRHIINHAEDKVIVCDPRLAPQLGKILEDCPRVEAVLVITTMGVNLPLSEVARHFPEGIAVHSYEALLDGMPTQYVWPELPERAPAALCYSTGTTGAPKGVVYSHRSIYLHSLSLRTTDSFAVAHGQTFLCCVPIYHVLSWGVPVAAFMSGAPMVFPGAYTDPAALAECISHTHPRAAHGVPSLWKALIVHYLHQPPTRMSLQEIFVGGSPVPPALIKLWEEHFGVDVIHVWGMTETSPVGTVSRPPFGVSGEARWQYRISQGRFPASMAYRVINDGQDVTGTDRAQGEIQVRGNWVTGAYYHSPTADAHGIAATFRGEAVEDAEEQFTEDGWLRTGDVGSVTKDGFLTIEDRARDVIRSGGEWIYSVQLENLIMEAPEVVEAAVIGYPDEMWGERPLAVVVPSQDIDRTAVTDTALARQLRERLGAAIPHWMVPEYWTFVDAIDKTSVEKFDKKDLRQHLAAGEYTIVSFPGPGTNSHRTNQ